MANPALAFSVSTWMNKLSALTGSNSFVRADCSIFLGLELGTHQPVVAFGVVRRGQRTS